MAKQPPDSAASDAPAPRKRGKLVLILGITVVALGGAGGGAWFFMRAADPNAQQAAAPAKPAVFLPLESFTVNLASQEGPQFLQAGLTLKLGDKIKTEVIKERMPEIRNRMLLVLTGKKAADLLPVSGKQKLALELADSVKQILGPAGGVVPAVPAAPVAPVAAGPGEAIAATPPVAAAAPAAPAGYAPGSEIEVLFTSFIIQ